MGHGQAVHIFTPNNQLIVVDLGCSDSFSPLTWLKEKVDRTTIDLLVITHPHGDHIDEIELVSKLGFTVRQLWRPKWLTEEEIRAANQVEYKEKIDAYLALSARYTETPAPGAVVGSVECSGGASLKTYASSTCGRSNINNHSGVAVLKYAQSTVVIPGDNEPASWNELLAQYEFASATSSMDVFLASHHGRESGYCGEVFADTRKPSLCVISDGRVKDTDATARYSKVATGWQVKRRGGQAEERKAVTTRSDGFVDVKLGYTAEDKPRPFVGVEIS